MPAGHVQLEQDLAPRLEGPLEEGEELGHGVALDRVGRRRRVGDELGAGLEEGPDDPETGGGQGPAGLGDLHHGVGDVGDLGLGGAVGEPDLGLDALLLEEPAGQLRILGGDPAARRAGRAIEVTGESRATARTTLMGLAVAFE